MKRKVFESQTIDYETGEVKSVIIRTVSSDNENFFMGRTTEGLEWLLDFNNLTEMQLLVLMIELENPKNNYIINFTGLQVKETAQMLKVSEIQIKKCLTGLIKNGFLKRVARANYMANPLCFYKGGTNNIMKKYEIFSKIR